MNKFFLALLIFSVTYGFALDFDILSYPPPVNGGNVMVDAGIGLTAYGDYGTIAVPPIFVNAEYALSANVPISVGGFAAFYRYNYRVIGDSGWQYTFFTFGGRAVWHWGFDVSWLDLYSGLWIGYNAFSADWVGGSYSYVAPAYGGLGYGFQGGARFYFKDNFGLVLESGYPFALKVGAAFKFGGSKAEQSAERSPAQQRNTQQRTAQSASNARPVGDTSEQMILRLAKESKGILTVSGVALETGLSLDEAKRQLDDFVAKGYAELRTRSNGAQVYVVPDFLEEPL